MPDDVDWSNYLDEFNSPGRVHFEIERRETPSFENFLTSKTTLKEHLLWQLLMTSPSDDEEQIGSFIIGNLNSDGYLDIQLEDIALATDTPVEKAKETLALLQTFDPIGVCARDLKECLLYLLCPSCHQADYKHISEADLGPKKAAHCSRC